MSFLDKKGKLKAVKFILPVIVWASVIFTFSSFPTVSTSNFYLWDFLLKKSAHVIEYGILATLIYRALVNYEVKKDKATLVAIFLAFLYGVTDEFHQSFVPGRGPKFTDTLIDAFGAWLFVYLIINKIKYFPNSIINIYKRLKIV